MAGARINRQYLAGIARQLDQAPRGDRGEIVARASDTLGLSPRTLHRALKAFRSAAPRQRRADAGKSKVTEEEALFVANLLKQSRRDNDKRLMTTELAIDIGRANGRILSDASAATFLRAMRAHGVHPDQLQQQATHTRMKSPHPNHAWEFDVSICVLYYLDKGGVSIMDRDRFYKNKPKNYAKIANDRVLRYLVTDHYSGAFFLRYYQAPGEQQGILFDFLIDAFGEKADPGKEPFHGVPFNLIWDLGSANQSQMIANFLDGLDVRHWAHEQGNPRAKGQVERHHELVERQFESRLSLLNVQDLGQLNQAAEKWTRYFNATKKHSRHGHSRYGLWQRVSSEQLRKRPTKEVCQALLESNPVARTVKGDLTIQHTVKGYAPARYSVEHIDWVRVGDKVDVRVNPYHAPNIFIIERDERGHEVRHQCVPIETDEAGFPVSAPIIGQEYKTTRDSVTDRRRKAMDKEAYGADTKAEVKDARRKRKPAFGGKIDPFADIGTPPVDFMRREGSALNVPSKVHVETKPLSHVEAFKRLMPNLGRAWTPEDNAWVRKAYPNGVPESELPTIRAALVGEEWPANRPGAAKAEGAQ